MDGHNLISKIPSLDLGMVDDEERLIELLNRYGEHSHDQLEVYFDGASVGQAGRRRYGRVVVHFIPKASTADEAICRRLSTLGKAARAWVVVTSDRSVQAAAREVHAGVVKSEDFKRILQAALQSEPSNAEPGATPPISPAEVDEWLNIFKAGKKDS